MRVGGGMEEIVVGGGGGGGGGCGTCRVGIAVREERGLRCSVERKGGLRTF